MSNKVYEAINNVQALLMKEGITKNRTNQMQGYKFRGIDDVLNAISSFLAESKLCILPRVLSRNCVERKTAKGGDIFYVTVDVEYDLVSAEDGSKHTVRVFGEAMDSSDKATNKAMSAAYKYMAIQSFAIPTEGDNDADTTTHITVSSHNKPLVKVEPVKQQIILTEEEHATYNAVCEGIAGVNTKEQLEKDMKDIKMEYATKHVDLYNKIAEFARVKFQSLKG